MVQYQHKLSVQGIIRQKVQKNVPKTITPKKGVDKRYWQKIPTKFTDRKYRQMIPTPYTIAFTSLHPPCWRVHVVYYARILFLRFFFIFTFFSSVLYVVINILIAFLGGMRCTRIVVFESQYMGPKKLIAIVIVIVIVTQWDTRDTI